MLNLSNSHLLCLVLLFSSSPPPHPIFWLKVTFSNQRISVQHLSLKSIYVSLTHSLMLLKKITIILKNVLKTVPFLQGNKLLLFHLFTVCNNMFCWFERKVWCIHFSSKSFFIQHDHCCNWCWWLLDLIYLFPFSDNISDILISVLAHVTLVKDLGIWQKV